MGQHKPLLPAGGETFLARAVRIERLGGCRRVVCVVAAGARKVKAEAVKVGTIVVVNAARDAEQIDSLRAGIAALASDAAAVVVLPVDHPAVSPSTIAALIRAFRSGHRSIVRPVYMAEPGHPTLFAREIFSELQMPLPEGARSLITQRAREIEDVPVDDPGVLLDVDTPADLHHLAQ
jgi:molybdenum cofactor cytidylyltransferase